MKNIFRAHVELVLMESALIHSSIHQPHRRRMIAPFENADGSPTELLIDALADQHSILGGDRQLAELFAKEGTLVKLSPGEDLIREDDSEDEIFFLLKGAVEILVKGKHVATRRSGSHVGEMSLIDPSKDRSATVRVAESLVALSVDEPVFTRIAKTNPDLWRRIAVELGERLRQRNAFIKESNQDPHVFIGSSSESLGVATAIHGGLKHRGVSVKLWNDDVFTPSSYPMESLENEIRRADFGVMVFGRDDKVVSRRQKAFTPRDNVVLELGMCIGFLGRERSFVVHPRNQRIRIPSDLHGLTALKFDPVRPKKRNPFGFLRKAGDPNYDKGLEAVCESLYREIEAKSVK